MYYNQHLNIVYEDEVIGGYDIEIEVQVRNEIELRGFMNEMRKIFSEIIKEFEVLH